MKNKSKIILALDIDTIKEAKSIIKDTKQYIDIYKIGPHLFTKYGPEIIKLVHKNKREVFLDLKLHDIPNTVASSVRQIVRLKVYMLTLHTFGGLKMLREAKKAAVSEAKKLKLRTPLLLGVTVLSSFEKKDLKQININLTVKDQVLSLLNLAQIAKLAGVVLSAKELTHINKVKNNKLLKVVPGIRPKGSKKDDQKRIMTPSEAIKQGADFLVIGRPIIKSASAKEAAENIIKEISKK
ncbi:MAG: orotidine-5'-phosphate decarboxylase [Candidatus Kappaea frigidicola]|nr:orotidine-5'-phosphate decarboxylase [Candidatus Kappaea frigidicola]